MGWFRMSVASVWDSLVRSKAETVIRMAADQFPLPSVEIDPGTWSVVAERRNTYRVTLFLSSDSDFIRMQASCELTIERELILREMALVLLEENHLSEAGWFRLVGAGEDRLVVLGVSLDRSKWFVSEIVTLGQAMIGRLQRVISYLYERGLIVSGPEQTPCRVAKGD